MWIHLCLAVVQSIMNEFGNGNPIFLYQQLYWSRDIGSLGLCIMFLLSQSNVIVKLLLYDMYARNMEEE